MLSRAATDLPAFPVRSVHLGLGAFHRAHQAWYAHASGWGIAAFTGRRPNAAETLAAQDGLYTLLVRGPDGDSAEIVRSISAAHNGADIAALQGYLTDPTVTAVTLTITEAGYRRGPDGRFSGTADIAALRAGEIPATAPARLLRGLMARRDADSGPIAVVPCDNLAENGPKAELVLHSLADAVNADLADWVRHNVVCISTMVDRITPASTDADRATAEQLTGFADRAPVVTEPFTEWLLTDAFPGTRPGWDSAGARFVDDVTPFETRKLWLLNGAHSMLAYAAPQRGHRTVAEAVADPECRKWMDEWWDEASRHLTLPTAEIAAYRNALVERFSNPRIQHLLGQIAMDGSQKLPFRVVPVVAAERAAGRMPVGGIRALAGWLLHLRAGDEVRDPRAAELTEIAAGPDATRRIVAAVDDQLAADDELIAAIRAEERTLCARS